MNTKKNFNLYTKYSYTYQNIKKKKFPKSFIK